jgi:hypothetical protein
MQSVRHREPKNKVCNKIYKINNNPKLIFDISLQWVMTLMMETACSSKKVVCTCQTQTVALTEVHNMHLNRHESEILYILISYEDKKYEE